MEGDIDAVQNILHRGALSEIANILDEVFMHGGGIFHLCEAARVFRDTGGFDGCFRGAFDLLVVVGVIDASNGSLSGALMDSFH